MSTERVTSDDLRDVHRGGVAHGEPRSLLARPLVWLIRLYQHTFSRILGPVCRYYPSCSAYGVTALERHGLLRGSWLTFGRVLRCNPWSAGGVDHVPARRDQVAHRSPAGARHTSSSVPDAQPAATVTPSSTPVSPAHHRD